MVGYSANDSMTQKEKLIAGCLSGVITRFVTQPMDVIKLRSQLVKKPKQRNVMYRVARRIFWEEGLSAFWHGHMLGQFHSVLAVSSQFYVYEIATKYSASLEIHDGFRVPYLKRKKRNPFITLLSVKLLLNCLVKAEKEKQIKYLDLAHEVVACVNVDSAIIVPITAKSLDQHLMRLLLGGWIKDLIQKAVLVLHIEHFVCGIVAGCICTTLVIPLEVIRVRQMLVKDQYKTFLQGAKAVYRYGGLLAFYEGLNASLLQMGPQVGISFAVFNFVQPLLLGLTTTCAPGECSKGNTHKPQTVMFASSVAGSAAGFVSKTLTYPFDLAKRRLQIGSHKTSLKYKTPSQAQNLMKCTKLFECLVLAYRKEGVRGLYRGWTVTIYKAQVTSIVAFTTYELLCHVSRDINAWQ